MRDVEKIITKIKVLPLVHPDSQMTANVMQAISRLNERPLARKGVRLYGRLKNSFAVSPTKEDCAISFISTGFFYFIFGLILWLFVKNMPLNSELSGWLKLQSPVFVFAALLLFALGGFLWLMGGRSLQFVRWGLVAYILIFIVNGLLISSKGNVQLVLGVIWSLGALLTGVLLNAAAGKYAHEYDMSKG